MNVKPYFLFVLLLTSCKSAMTLQDTPPSPVLSAYFYEYISGQSDSGRGYELVVALDNPAVILDSVSFINQHQAMTPTSNGFKARFNLTSTADMIMSSNPKEEYGNQMPTMNKPNYPRQTDLNCVIRYTYQNKTGRFKIENLEERAALYYPGKVKFKEQ